MVKKSIDDLRDLRRKRALVRVDFNVPIDGQGRISNDRRIRAAAPTLQRLLDRGGAAIVMSHLGRPKGDASADRNLRMDRVAERLGEVLGRPVQKCDEVVGPAAEEAVQRLRPGDVLVLENLRFEPGEQKGDEGFARRLAALGDVYVNDAFGTCHRADASMVAVPHAMAGKPRVVGLLLAKELDILGKLLTAPPHPFIAVLGGAKVTDKIGFIESLLARVDRVLIGGAMTYTFMKCQGRGTGRSKVEGDKLDLARTLLERGRDKIVLPLDHRAVRQIEPAREPEVVDGDVPNDLIAIDIGPRTAEMYQKDIAKAAMVVWNGPVGKFEDKPYRHGTRAIAEAMAAARAVTIVGGGETAEAVEELGLADRMTHVSTGGGAFLEYIEGTPFPALAELDERPDEPAR
jgi:phosphoglycerate kinase